MPTPPIRTTRRRREASLPIHAGDLVLLDVWGKQNKPGAVYFDITWTGYVGEKVPEQYTKVFDVVREARDAAIILVQKSLQAGRILYGYEVDDAAREVIERKGYGTFFVHRTGHSIGEDVHGNGANMDNFETHDERRIIARTCFSIEPGIYLHDFGIRSEVNVFTGRPRGLRDRGNSNGDRAHPCRALIRCVRLEDLEEDSGFRIQDEEPES